MPVPAAASSPPPASSAAVILPEGPSVTRRLYGLLLPYRAQVAWGMLFLTLSVAAELYPPLVWGTVIDHGLTRTGSTFTPHWAFIGWQLALLVGVFAVQQVLSAWRGLLLERAGQQLTLDLRLRLYNKLASQSAGYFEAQRTGDLLSRVTADVDGIQDVLLRGTDAVLGNALRLVGVVAIFIALQPLLGVVVTLPMLVVGLLLTPLQRVCSPGLPRRQKPPGRPVGADHRPYRRHPGGAGLRSRRCGSAEGRHNRAAALRRGRQGRDDSQPHLSAGALRVQLRQHPDAGRRRVPHRARAVHARRAAGVPGIRAVLLRSRSTTS